MKQLTVALAVFNEEKNLEACLASVKDIAQEIVVVDGSSTDQTVAIAKRFGARVLVTNNPPIFHINKQKAIDMAKSEWILQLDADERVSPELAKEIMQMISMSDNEIALYQEKLTKRKLFLRHQKLLEKRDGHIGTKDGPYAAFFIPRLNYFLGRYMRYGGVYPDGVIRLIRKGKAYLPCKDVHEQMAVEGRVGWLEHDLYHIDSPTFSRYLERNKRYINLLAKELQKDKKNTTLFAPVEYLIVLPIRWFLLTYLRHKGFRDGWPGFVFSFFSALRFPRAYLKSLLKA
ncbi:MAG TPA: glycosyltransferase family 2 protein [Candidatus Sulfotelmatobacter sp.]|jgi:(heptosyl)LPS beta-1,4-glucosyltransferase|nr:glycosyltransferase family 2 protein [Candidatus Sulfotelmatobacter sp.]